MINVIDRNFNYLAVIDNFESLQFTRSWSSIGSFEIHININKNNTEYLQKENIIFIDEKRAGVILYREIDAETETLIIRGLQLKSYINRYITIPPEGAGYDIQNNYSENIIKNYVYNNLVNPDKAIRKFNNLMIEVTANMGMQLKYQTRYKNLAEEIEKIANVSGLGWDIHLDLENKKFVFKVLQGRNLTGGQTENPQIVFSIEFDNIANQKLVENKLNYRGTGIVAGQGEGQNRAVEVVNNDIEGIDRFEVFIDARDIEDSEMLYDRGITKLEEFKEILSFDNEILTDTNVKYMIDYDIGDIITARNDKWGAMLDSQIMEVTEVYEEDFKIMATFGNDTPTLMQTIKRQLDEPISEGGAGGEIDYNSVTGALGYVPLNEEDFTDTDTIIEVVDNLTSTDTDKALSANMGRELFQSVSNGKSLIAGAITDKGVITSPSDSFSVMADNIGEIASGSLWATGESTSSYVISGLSFTPSYVYVFQSGSQEFRKTRTIVVEEPSLAYSISTSGDFIQYSHITINSNGFEVDDRISRPYKWVAIE